MTPTRRTGQNQEAEAAKKVALPPSASSARPNGVSTVSSATLPTTRSDIVDVEVGDGVNCIRGATAGFPAAPPPALRLAPPPKTLGEVELRSCTGAGSRPRPLRSLRLAPPPKTPGGG